MNICSFCKLVFPEFVNLCYLLTLNEASNESSLICDSGKTLRNDLNSIIKSTVKMIPNFYKRVIYKKN